MDYNFHTHTFRCGHADGMDEEYVLWAINNGIKTLGFSDHIPLKFENGFESSFRVPISCVNEYFDSLNYLREKYKGKIEIHIGFESEFYEKYFEDMLSNVVKWGAEYLILGPHFFNPENLDSPRSVHIYNRIESVELLEEYSLSVVSAMRTGKFTYVAHPDMFNFIGEKEVYLKSMRKICVASRELQIPLEINFLGIIDKRSYPNELFWQLAGEEKAPVTFGCDAHTPRSIYNINAIERAKVMVKKFDLNYIGKPKIVPLKW